MLLAKPVIHPCRQSPYLFFFLDPDTILMVDCDQDPVMVNWRTSDEFFSSVHIGVACLINGSMIVSKNI